MVVRHVMQVLATLRRLLECLSLAERMPLNRWNRWVMPELPLTYRILYALKNISFIFSAGTGAFSRCCKSAGRQAEKAVKGPRLISLRRAPVTALSGTRPGLPGVLRQMTATRCDFISLVMNAGHDASFAPVDPPCPFESATDHPIPSVGRISGTGTGSMGIFAEKG